MEATLSFFFATILVLSTSHASPSFPFQNHRILLHSDGAATSAANHHRHKMSCPSWRLAVETNNIIKWTLVPEACEDYVAKYMLGSRYQEDCFAVTSIALEYAKNHTLGADGKDIWVFDIDETALSEIDYYSQPDVSFGAKKFNETKKNEYLKEAKSPPLAAVLELYNNLLPLGYKIVFISGTSESYREYRESNMKRAGYHTWEKLMLKQTSEHGTTSFIYKSNKRTELVKAGYRIIGNMGDQWSDILGSDVGNRTFKLPNPMYYIS
ncbi:hypothetical protein RHSIM_Rhsim12G0203600 [Rhododendron simsii]|uniref:Acid phosphatase n=1 Tax=Rhododendron simsii TaxID=118357 RepID=A0A834G8M2_RHOSS|nr:hypothetical protein RHSIM_Rhsim12G0203600 [Rhododendron simsii]